jgi:hypothetical protein
MERVFVVIRVFSWTEEEEERNDDHVSSSLKGVINHIWRSQDRDPTDDSDGDGLDVEGCRVRVFPRMEGPLKAEIDLICGVEPWVLGPHIEGHLGIMPYVIFSQSRPDGISADCKFARMYLLGKDL